MSDSDPAPRPTVAVTGASGFVGTALRAALEADGARVLRLVRRPAGSPDEVSWDPDAGTIDAARLEGADAVVHLAGENIAGVWTRAKKRRIRESRERGTRLVASALAGLAHPPRVLVSASGINVYGDRGEELVTESDPPGDDFLARVCVAWEEAADPARAAGIRVVHGRMGIVLDPTGGALPLMLPIFRLGLGGRLGDGDQWMSWIGLDDAVRAFRFAIDAEALSGPVNLVAPEPVRNRDFTQAVADAVHRPALLAVPSFALRAATGGMAEALLLSSIRAEPGVLARAGFAFTQPTVADALRPRLDGNGWRGQTVP